MRILFVDDSGGRRGSTENAPYFCLGAFSVDSAHLKQLRHRLGAIKQKWRLKPLPEDEIKFNCIGRDYDTTKKPNPLVRLGYDRPQRAEFGQEVLRLLAAVPSVKVFGVGIDRRTYATPLNWAFKLLLERFEFSLNEEDPRVGMVICDQEDCNDDEMREAMHAGTPWTTFPNVAETAMFVPSHRSPGVQFADFVAGSMGRWWNHNDLQYLDILKPVLATTALGSWRGAGLKSFPVANYPIFLPPDLF